MKSLILMFAFFGAAILAAGQERYYLETPTKGKARYEIDLKNSKIYNSDTINFKIESLTLLKPDKTWRDINLQLMAVSSNVIYTNDSKGVNLYLFDSSGNPIRKIDLSKVDKHFKITDSEFYNDTLFLVDNESLFLLKFTSVGDFIAKETLPFNFDDFKVDGSGIFFISKHLDEKKEKGVRISVFDFSLNLLKLYFVTDRQNPTELRPRFHKGEGTETLFSVTESNQIYNISNGKVALYLQVHGGIYIWGYTYGLGFHMLGETFFPKGRQQAGVIITYYFPKGKLKDGIRLYGGNALNLSVFCTGLSSHIYHDGFMSFKNMKDVEVANMLRMEWAEDHSYIKDELLELIKQVDENNKFVVARYKVIENREVFK